MARQVFVEKYFPDVLSVAEEFTDIANAENPEFELLYSKALKWFLNGFVLDLDADGATRWEEMLSLTKKDTDILETRQRRILAKINDMLPYTHRQLENLLTVMYGADAFAVDIEYDKYILWIVLANVFLQYQEELKTYLRAIVPANLSIGTREIRRVCNPLYTGAYIRSTKHVLLRVASFEGAGFTSNLYCGGNVRVVSYFKFKGVM